MNYYQITKNNEPITLVLARSIKDALYDFGVGYLAFKTDLPIRLYP